MSKTDLELDIDNSSKKSDIKVADESVSIQQGELRKSLGLFSLLGVGFGLTNSWYGISSSLQTSIASGGPIIVVYGIIIIAFISLNVAIMLSEFASMIPSAGGQYVWTRVLAPRKYSSFLAYMCGSFGWVGSIFTSASMALAVASQIMGLWNIMHPDHITKKWQLFVLYELVNLVLMLFNCNGQILPILGNSALYVSLFSYTVITITVLVCARGSYQPATFVFKDFDGSATGWTGGIAFILGLVNPNWSFSCLDCATHMAEEIMEPERFIPMAVIGTVGIGFVTSFTYSISMFFSIQDFQGILDSTTGSPILDIYHQALDSKTGAVCLGVLLLLTACGCTISSHTWQARLCWSFARDNGLPFSNYLKIVDPKLRIPINAHLFSTVIVAILGVLYMVSDTAFNSMVIGTITFLLLSYSVPILCLLYRGRDKVRHGPFWLGKIGMVSNIICLLWTAFGLVFYSFPTYLPVTAGSMNYISAVYGIYIILTLGFWWFPYKPWSCRENFAGGLGNSEELEFPDVCLEDI
ncbi:choline transport protein [[Candida] jaroonii]|uniref:Choline transport protein n=1 Tax=[Candida] jaroonii TaxID=467808 RepID=A0ACA9Y3T1_9ASCO|nr:choline transport protein [[Candida] jaroonii]